MVDEKFWKENGNENFLVDLGKKHLSLTIYIPSSQSNQTKSKKFSFPFSFQSFPSTLFYLQTNTPLELHMLIIIIIIWVKIFHSMQLILDERKAKDIELFTPLFSLQTCDC